MGYVLVLIIGVAVVVLLLVAFMSGKRRPVGRAGGGPVSRGGDVTSKMPAADEPNPAASATADPRQAREAQEHTPPA